MKTREEILLLLKTEIASETGIPVSEISDSANFSELELNSISAIFILDVLEKRLEIEMDPLFFCDHPTVELLAEHITTLFQR